MSEQNHEHEHAHDHEHITVIDENGNEELYAVLLTFEPEKESPFFGNSYVYCYPESEHDAEEVELQVYTYIQQPDGTAGELKPVLEDDEWEMVEEVLNTFLVDEEEAE
ncbi:putative nucleic acid binding protein [Brochothrix thermosphacta]|uniref:DUF1292 domain-containing protein n=1 Tax=Brochothrix thermosphacta TaxID=2756 RepID=UPI000D1009F1|nr:DUF1292 domain-containing protein [Brochothrix thermosphacta]SOC32372.1 putative nucleic acid binding protein [Brochothrix thermosphacta]